MIFRALWHLSDELLNEIESLFNQVFKKYYNPLATFAIDESCRKCRCQGPKVFNPTKANRWHLKFFLLVDSNKYVYDFTFYYPKRKKRYRAKKDKEVGSADGDDKESADEDNDDGDDDDDDDGDDDSDDDDSDDDGHKDDENDEDDEDDNTTNNDDDDDTDENEDVDSQLFSEKVVARFISKLPTDRVCHVFCDNWYGGLG